ncbi:MAG: hypothetical protein QOG83_3220, partial [Alphaproteobacteria bacterium]|nr:hypothetical protein [Alphaproteobacteria bacterium]
YGHQRHKVEIHQLRMLAPPVIKSLRALLNEYPQWEIIVAVDIPGKESAWPPMGVTIRRHEIIDGLQRQYLPDEFQGVAYEGSKQA